MASSSRIGRVRINVDGEWDVRDLLSLAEGLTDPYGIFFPLVCQDEAIRTRLYDELRRLFWSGDSDSRWIGRRLYGQVPADESLKLKSFNYSSPGFMELAGVLSLLILLAKVAQAWIKTGDQFVDLWKKVDKFFSEREGLKRPRREIQLDEQLSAASDDARVLVFEVGEKLGFDALSCERIIGIVGNPIAALKYLVAAANEGRKLAELQRAGLIQLPSPSDDPIIVEPDGGGQRRRGPGITVVRKPKRKKRKE